MSSRISVAMATCEGEPFLGEQLASLTGQDRRPDELIISDDASGDTTLEIVHRFARSAPFQVTVLANETRIGAAANFSRAYAACTGDLVAFCDQDDVWLPSKLEVSAAALESDPTASVVHHSGRAVDAGLRPLRFDSANRIHRHSVVAAGAWPPAAMVRPGCMLMLRRSRLGSPDHLAEGVSKCGLSHDAWAAVVGGALGNVHHLPDELILYRRHSRTATESWSGHLTRQTESASTSGSYRLRRLLDSARPDAGAEDYRERASTYTRRAALLEQLRPTAAGLDSTAEMGLQRAINAHRALADALERRARAYSSTRRPQRAQRIVGNALRGDYRRRGDGRLGSASLLKDLTIGLAR